MPSWKPASGRVNTNEGLMRIAMVVRWAGYLIAAFLIVGGAIEGGSGWWVAPVIGLGIGVVGWVIAWIIEGFAKPKG